MSNDANPFLETLYFKCFYILSNVRQQMDIYQDKNKTLFNKFYKILHIHNLFKTSCKLITQMQNHIARICAWLYVHPNQNNQHEANIFTWSIGTKLQPRSFPTNNKLFTIIMFHIIDIISVDVRTSVTHFGLIHIRHLSNFRHNV